MKLWTWLVIVVTCGVSFFWVQPVFSAQSTADVVVDSSQKEELRREIVGDMVLPGEQQEYVIGHGDVLTFSIYGEGDMAASEGETGIVVRNDGRVSLQHLGDVHIAGMTLTQAADYLKKLYITVFDDPIITVVLVTSGSRRYTVMGQANNAGIFQLDVPVTIIEAIARSGSFNKWANHEVTVIRQGSGPAAKRNKEKKTLTFDYDDFLDGKDLDKNIYLQPNDVMVLH